MSNGYDAQDMATQGADGFRNGYQAGYSDAVKAFDAAQPAAAQEAAWNKTKPTAEGAYYVRGFNLFQLAKYEALVQVRTHHFDGEPAPELVCNIHESTSNDGMDDWSPIVEMSEDFEWFGPLFAAPVAAAPIDGWDAQAYSQMAGELEAWKLRAVTAEGDFNRLCNAMNAEDGPTHMGEPVLNTPAAPGIDLREPMRNLYRAYVRLLESGMDRITSLGGDCDPVDVMEANDIDLRAAREALDASPKGAVHPDDLAVDAFAAAMKAKLAEARAKGRGGWNGDEPDMQERLSNMLRDHIEKGDPRDVANFCMFLHQRGEGISPNGGSADESIDLLSELRDVEDYFNDVDPNPVHLATVRQAISVIAGCPKGGINSRATFEAWAAGKILPLHRMQIHIGIMGDYSDAWTHCAWTAWQAAMQATSPKGVEHFQDRLAEIEGRPRPEPEVDEVEEVAACLGDDAAAMLDENPEDERALNMQRAAELLAAMQATSAEVGA